MSSQSTDIHFGPGWVQVAAWTYDGRGPIFSISQPGGHLQFSLSEDTSPPEREEFANALVAAAAKFAAAVHDDNARLAATS